MDANRFDRLTRLFARGPSRRDIVGFSASGIMASLLGLASAEGKKGKKRKKKGKGKKCKRPPCGPCTVSTDGGTLVVKSKLKKKPLRLLQQTDFAGGARQTEITFKGKSVLKITHETVAPGMVTTVTYGTAFSGINQARFASDGVTITGDIDGRAIAPLAVGAGPVQLAFADGGPPLDVRGDARLVQAIQGLFAKAAHQAGACEAAQQKSVGSVRSTFDCVKSHAECLKEAAECEKSVIEAAGSVCNIVPLLGPIACGVVGTGYCAERCATCIRKAKYGPSCCSVRCGGDVEDLFGPDPLCCDEGQTCLDPNSNRSGGCCAAGMTPCGGQCCPAGSCTSGLCCTTGVGSICGDRCCGPFDTCCDGRCCTGVCNGNICCIGGELPCGSGCCSGTCCNGSCCPEGRVCCNGICCQSGFDCQNNQCIQVCNPGEIPCAGRCCTGGQACYLCPNGARVCRSGPCIN